MHTLINKFDTIEQIIQEKSLKIAAIDFHSNLGIMLIVLNTGIVLQQNIKDFPTLEKATDTDLKNYKIIANGTGVHWINIDEDLSLKGFLTNHFTNVVVGGNKQNTFAA